MIPPPPSVTQITCLESFNPRRSNVSEEERVANEAAASFCVPQDKLERFIARKSPFYTDRDILGFSRTLKCIRA